MSYKMTGKILTDLVMTILLLLLMARQITGDSAHEWLGAAMFVLWVLHHVFNFRWYTHLLPGKAEPLKKLYPPARIVRIIVNFLLLLSMLGTMISGVILSREVFAFLPISGGIALARPLLLFFTEYIGIMGLFVFLAYYGSRIFRRPKSRTKS